ncbi:MAG: glycosyltransferase family 4 protein [Planctomycetes bacterium]|nr:glycosyltransferase family 4 protein [Planctomycetota bacterium]
MNKIKQPLCSTKIGTIHTLLCYNDGVSIVINQIVESLKTYLKIAPDNFSFACGKYGGDLYDRVWADDSLWHKDDTILYALKHYETTPPPQDLEDLIEARVSDAKKTIEQFFDESGVDVIIAHNTCHPVNLIYALAIHRVYEERKNSGQRLPHYLMWWHDSHLERERFLNSNELIQKYILEGVPGPHVEGIVFINSGQWDIARTYFQQLTKHDPHIMERLNASHIVVPNTCDIPNNWPLNPDQKYFAPQLDLYNADFLESMGITGNLSGRDKTLKDCLLFLQHTRVVPRKRIDHAIDFCFAMANRYKSDGKNKKVFLLISGPTGDELSDDVTALTNQLRMRSSQQPDLDVEIVWGEKRIRSRRDVVNGVKYYSFEEIPGIIAYYGGMGTYFSDVEGFGNNLLELISLGVPPVVREYPVYLTDIAIYGFEIPSTPDGTMTPDLVERAYKILNDTDHRKSVVRKNAEILRKHLGHNTISENLNKLWETLNC